MDGILTLLTLAPIAAALMGHAILGRPRAALASGAFILQRARLACIPAPAAGDSESAVTRSKWTVWRLWCALGDDDSASQPSRALTPRPRRPHLASDASCHSSGRHRMIRPWAWWRQKERPWPGTTWGHSSAHSPTLHARARTRTATEQHWSWGRRLRCSWITCQQPLA